MLTRTPDPRAVQQRAQEPGAIGPMLGLTGAERERASLTNYVRAAVLNDKNELAFFRELGEQTEKATETRARGINTYYTPGDVLMGRRTLEKATPSSGGFLASTGLGGFSDALAASSVLGALPVTRLPSLKGDTTVARETARGTAQWLSTESSTAPDVQGSFGLVTLTPKTIAASVVISRQLLLQAGVNAQSYIVERALGQAIGEAIDRALVGGTGGAEPMGLRNLAGTDTRAGTSLALSDAAAMLRVCEGFADSDSVRWLAGVATAQVLRTRPKVAGQGEMLMGGDGRLLAKDVIVSRSVGDQVLIACPWSQVWMASWGALEVAVDAATNFISGRVVVRALMSLDLACERPASVAVATAVT